MSKRLAFSIVAGVLTAAIYAGIVWVSGYNFDTRGILVAIGVAYGAVCAGFASYTAYIVIGE